MDVDEFWSAILEMLRELAPVEVRRSRFAPKPAIWVHGREIAHWEGPGIVELRITARGWMSVRDAVGGDSALRHDAKRRDWIELRGRTPADAEQLRPVLETAIASNS